jgi:hypothetical protein
MTEKITTTETIPANVLKANPDYIRVKVRDDHVNLMEDKLKESKGVWPFPPISVQPIPIVEEKLIKEGYRYYIIDGHNRSAAALKAGLPVKAIVYTGLSKIETICMQVKENIANGLAFNHMERKRAIDLMAKEGLKQIEICQKTGLPRYTVSRVLSSDPEKITGASGDPRKAPRTPGKKVFDPGKWETSLYKVMEGWEKRRKTILKIKGFPEGLEKALDAVANALPGEEEEKSPKE